MYIPSTNETFPLPSIPGSPRVWHTLTGNVLCGGVYRGTSSSCLELTETGEGWKPYSTVLTKPRLAHSNWASPEGIVLLGGYYSGDTTELVTSGGTSDLFSMPGNVSYACAIGDESEVILTGGFGTRNTVSKFSMSGFVSNLPDLKIGRQYHACASYHDIYNKKTYLVTGGFTGFENTKKTEILPAGAAAWIMAGELPRPRNGLRSTSVNNMIYLLGGDTEILEFDSSSGENGEWRVTAQMTKKAGIKLEVSTINCSLVHKYIEPTTIEHPSSSTTQQSTKPSSTTKETLTKPTSPSQSTTTTTPKNTATGQTTTTTSKIPTPTQPDKCYTGWTPYDNSCYKVFTEKVSWEDARQTCVSSNNADLASITSEAERTFAWELAGQQTTWIGGSDQETEGTFTWSDGTPWDNPLWSPGNPNNEQNDQDCVTMWDREDGLLDDDGCDTKHPFICEQKESSKTSGFLIAAGVNSRGHLRSTEEFKSFDSTPVVGNIAESRSGASFCNNVLCGGAPADRSCEKFDGISAFNAMSVSLVERRDSHLCWGLQGGEVLLLGGRNSQTTTELISADGTSSKADFDLPFKIGFACGVEMGNKFVVTGGMNYSSFYSGVSTVAEFSLSGFVRFLPEMKSGRRSHACSKFVTDSGHTALMVAGGATAYDGGAMISTVEIMIKETWSYIESLPFPIYYLTAATLDNSVSVFGGAIYKDGYVYYDEIFTYNGIVQNSWDLTGRMREPRASHIVTPLAQQPKKNNEIGTIDSWGPLFRVSLDLIINKLTSDKWTSILAFKTNDGTRDMGQHGDRCPAMFLNKDGHIYFVSSVGSNANYATRSKNIQLNKWMRIIIEQTKRNGKVYFTVSVDGQIVHEVENTNPRTFEDVKVFAGDNFYPAPDASYKNVHWENIESAGY